MRKLATIQRISAIREIPGADKIEAADVLGWTVVIKKGEFAVGDLVVYFEVDSWLDSSNPVFASFEERFTNWGDRRGMRLKTIKLRKQISQGLIMAVGDFADLSPSVLGTAVVEGQDVTETLKVEKWEAPEERESNAGGKGQKASPSRPFPWFLRVTDQVRIQNVGGMILSQAKAGTTFEVTKKLDGSSMTIFYIGKNSQVFPDVLSEMQKRSDAKMGLLKRAYVKLKRAVGLEKTPEYLYGVCSRNVWLTEDGSNHFSEMARALKAQIVATAASTDSIAFQGELVSPSIQSNYEKVSEAQWYVFDVFDIDMQEYLMPYASRMTTAMFGLNYVPVVEPELDLCTLYTGDDAREFTDVLLAYAEGPGMNPGVKREGLVFKSNIYEDVSFKAISNSYLLAKG